MLYEELREYKDTDIKAKCLHLLKYFIDFNSRKQEKFGSVIMDVMLRREHKNEFEKCTEKSTEYLMEQKAYLRRKIIKTMRILNSIDSFKTSDVYLALKYDLEEMEEDLKAIVLLFKLIREHLYNLTIGKELLEEYTEDTKKFEAGIECIEL